MKNRRCINWVLSCFTVIPIACNTLTAFHVSAEAAEKVMDVPYQLYQSAEQYDCNSNLKVNSMLYGRATMGDFKVHGDISDVSTYDARTAYGLNNGKLSFDYLSPSALTDPSLNYYIVSDTATKVDTIDLGASVGKGAIIIEKSTDCKKWKVVSKLTDFFSGNPKGRADIYTTAGEDTAKGCFYRVTLAYQIETIVDNRINSFDCSEIADFFSNAYDRFDVMNLSDMFNKPMTSRHVERYEFYVCRNDGRFSLHNLALQPTTIPEQEGYGVNITSGETLEDGSVTTKGFTIDFLEADYDCTVNGRKVPNGETVRSNGKYTVTVKTKLGKELSKNVYVLQDKNQGFHSYFNESLVRGERVHNNGEYPSYAYGSELFIKEYSWKTPPLYGVVQNLTTGVNIEINERMSSGYHRILDIGEYKADLFCGKESSGNLTHYQFHFNIIDREGKPYLNHSLLTSRLELHDYKTKHYEVTYQTTGGGYIYVCFADEEDAYNYAYEIEKRFIEKNNGSYYYKNPNNTQNDKVKYQSDNEADRINLTKALVENARQNVKTAYFDSSEPYTFQTFTDKQELLDNLEALSLRTSIHVFPSEEERRKLIDRGTDLIKNGSDSIENRVSYLNGYRFIQVGDYDVEKVTASLPSGEETSLKFGWKVEKLMDMTAVYTITETNKYGKTNSYDACLMARNATESKWTYTANNEVKDVTYNAGNLIDKGFILQADTLQLLDAVNPFDAHALIKITDPNNESHICLNAEMQGVVLYEKGIYQIDFIDRVGNVMSFKADISGNTDKEDALKNSAKILNNIDEELKPLKNHRKKDQNGANT